jgi:hypothetical protein
MGNQYLKTVLVKYLEEVVRYAAMTWAGGKGSIQATSGYFRLLQGSI